MTDEELFQRRTYDAYFVYCNRYRGLLIRFANERLNNLQDAEDIAQSTLSVVWMKEHLEVVGSVRNLLLTIATRRVYRILRWRDKQKQIENAAAELQDRGAIAPRVIPPLVQAALQHGLGEVDPADRKILETFAAGYKPSEAAHKLRMHTRCYNRRLCEALKKLRKKLHV